MTALRTDRRAQRTKETLIRAFNELILSGGSGDIRVADIVERANVGRSTFYEHYNNADDIFLQAFSRPLAVLADAASGRGDPQALASLLEHFWENRQRARAVFKDKHDQIARLLARMIEERLSSRNDEPVIAARLAAAHLAAAPLGAIRSWIAGESAAPAAALAQALCNAADASLKALYPVKNV